MKFVVAIAALCLLSTQAVNVSLIGDDVDDLANKLGHQGAENDDDITDALEEQKDIREHQKDQEKLRKKYLKKIHRNDNWREEMKAEAAKKDED